ncbi:lasso peptide biosynthesis B2 protein [Brevundimonas sp.]|uniref:lasso peptide biosynthesis B2 protein n=1 Tax=Brevundimonas sp. TaxID=1871086 RepID=UPI002C359060|nr:lasso peptide biosynthesis B2 protein [Brevundimonas sp.]HWQ85386.1 lasso peptide biosynthesis B2 protein [Brevundimonas sp.]
MTVEVWCAAGVFLAPVGEDVVVLDVNADQYHCLLDGADWMAVGEGGSVTVPDECAANLLLGAGVAVGERPQPPRRTPEPVRRQLATTSTPSKRTLLRAGFSLAAATISFRGKSLRQLVQACPAASSPAPHGLHDVRTLIESVTAVQAALPWIPFEGECLQRAFQIRRVLARRGIHPDWVFGVRTWPFAAHCWLQIGDLVIADTLDRVNRYTPIMVV